MLLAAALALLVPQPLGLGAIQQQVVLLRPIAQRSRLYFTATLGPRALA